jgi:hypothetical protein
VVVAGIIVIQSSRRLCLLGQGISNKAAMLCWEKDL